MGGEPIKMQQQWAPVASCMVRDATMRMAGRHGWLVVHGGQFERHV